MLYGNPNNSTLKLKVRVFLVTLLMDGIIKAIIHCTGHIAALQL